MGQMDRARIAQVQPPHAAVGVVNAFEGALASGLDAQGEISLVRIPD